MSWILNIIVGSSIISYILTGLRIIILLPAACIPVIVTGVYYYIGTIHNDKDDSNGKTSTTDTTKH